MKVGQKIVAIKSNWSHPDGAQPKKYEVVTHNGYSVLNPGFIYLKEYPRTKTGQIQAFLSTNFRPLDEVLSEISIEEFINQPLEV